MTTAFLASLLLHPALVWRPAPPPLPTAIAANEFAARRARVMKELGPNEIAVFFTNPVRNRNNDVDFVFRPDSTFWYLTGFGEPDAALILAPAGIVFRGERVTEALFVNEPTNYSKTWLSPRVGSKAAPGELGIGHAFANDQFGEFLDAAKGTFAQATLPSAASGELAKMVDRYTTLVRNQKRESDKSLERILGRHRTVKSPAEIDLLRYVVEISAMAHIQAMRSVKPGDYEYEVDAVIRYVTARAGSEALAYPSIVGSGPNALILHYDANRRQMKAGDLVLVDAGAEYQGYAADITRTFPISGKFTPPQREIYEIVLAAQLAGIEQCRTGRPFRAAHEAATKVIAAGLKRLGIIKNDTEVSRYFMHGTSHFLGLDVHDSHGSQTLAPGMVLTVEPGIYIGLDSDAPARYRGIGVRIEDDILVTAGEPENLSRMVPKTIPEIEALMRGPGLDRGWPRPPGQ